jgi:deferrochelatase/peroxidase EfeB
MSQLTGTPAPGKVPTLQLDDIQGVILRTRPSRYVGTYIWLRIDDQQSGRQLMGRLADLVDSAANWWQPALPALLNVALTFTGLKASGVPPASLASFPPEFQHGLAARAAIVGDIGESAPTQWEKPFGTSDVHAVLAIMAGTSDALAVVLDRARRSRRPPRPRGRLPAGLLPTSHRTDHLRL